MGTGTIRADFRIASQTPVAGCAISRAHFAREVGAAPLLRLQRLDQAPAGCPRSRRFCETWDLARRRAPQQIEPHSS